MKKKRKLDGVLIFMAFVAFILLSTLTITQQLQIAELARQQTVILVIVDEKLSPISEKVDKLLGIIWEYNPDWEVIYATEPGNSDTPPK